MSGDADEVSEVHRGRRYVVTRRRRGSADHWVVCKTVRPDGPNPAAAAMLLEHEYRLLMRLALPGMARPLALEHFEGRPVLVLEDAGPQALDAWLHRRPLPLERFLALARELAGTVKSLHARSVVHGDISAPNVVIDVEGHTTLIDFDHAISLAKTPQGLPPQLEGITAYTAPEATGRVNRLVDARADLYALGAVFYELLTGAPPFSARSPLELVHAHLAQAPVAPTQLNPVIPAVLSDLVLKLLEKMPEARYQSAEALCADLDLCADGLTATGHIPAFDLGLVDVARELPIPDKLYQRQAQRAMLLSTIDRAALGAMPVVWLTGSAGVGKSSLAAELRPPILQRGGRLLGGKFDLRSGEAPYSALAEAIQKLALDLSAEPPAERALWRERLSRALGPNAGAIAELAPEIERLLGDTPARPPLGPVETENVFRMALQALFRTLARCQGPLLLLLDDVQWADAASLRLLRFLATGGMVPHLVLLLVLRDDEMGPDHPVAQALADIEAAGTLVDRIEVFPLDANALTEMLSEALGSEPARVEALAAVVARKTGGNPFFLRRWLHDLQRAGLLRQATGSESWQWDLASIESQSVSENVVDFLLVALGRLPPDARELVAAASCIGRRFSAALLAVACERTGEATTGALAPALRDGLVAVRRDPAVSADPTGRWFEFAHDRVQQAAAALLDSDKRQALHLRIGRALLAQTPERQLEQQLFTIADHLHGAGALLVDAEERRTLAGLDLRAGRKAKRSSAYAAAAAYLRHGIALLPPDAWQSHHDLSFDLHREAIECAYPLGEPALAQRWFKIALSHATSPLEVAGLYGVWVNALVSLDTLEEGLAVGSEGLRRLGLDLPRAAGDPAITAELAAVEGNLAGRSLTELLAAPALTDPLLSAIMQLMADTLVAAYTRSPPLAMFMAARRVNLSLRHGHCPSSGRAYVEYAVLLQRLTGQYRKAHELGRLGVALADRAASPLERGRVYAIFGSTVGAWCEPVAETIPLLHQAQAQALANGDVLFATGAATSRILLLFHQGAGLGRVLSEIDEVLKMTGEAKVQADTHRLLVYRGAIRRLRGLPAEPLAQDEGVPHRRATITLVAAYLLGDVGEARRAMLALDERMATFTRSVEPVEHNFFGSLTLAACWPAAAPQERLRLVEGIAENQRALANWAEVCPENYRHKHLLVAAELARLQGETAQAARLYDQAIEAAARAEFHLDEALGYELYGRFCRDLGQRRTSAMLLDTALDRYGRWGAGAKIEALELEFPELVSRDGVRVRDSVRGPGQELGLALDQMSLYRAAETISGEVVLDRLLDKLVRVCLATAGAVRGALIMEEEDGPFVRARGSGDESVWLQRIPLGESDKLPISAIELVRGTREALVLADAGENPSFATDPYVVRHQVRSVLALPIVRSGRLLGVLYLENNLATRAFSPERIRVLQLLSSQMAVALENSLLFDKLTREIDERKRAEGRVRFLAESGAALARSLDYETTIVTVGRLAVSVLADWCTIDLVVGGQGRRAVAVHRDPAKESLLKELRRLQELHGPPPTLSVMESGRSVLYGEFSDDLLARWVPAARSRQLVHELGACSLMMVPIGVPGRLFGVMALVSADPQRQYGPEDLALAEELSRRAALAIDNARLYRESRQAVRLRDDFLSIASHELNTPIAVLTLTIENLKQALADAPEDRAQLQRLLAVAERQGGRLSRLIGDLLDVTRLETGPLPIRRRKVELGELVRAAAASLAIEFERSGTTLELTAPYAVVGHWDPDRLEQIVVNLLSNAAKFGPGRPIAVRVACAAGRAELSVQDQGIGVTPDLQLRIFDRFARAVPPEQYGGLGLGLYISRQLVEAHGGTIAVRSEPGQGATFTVWLPLDHSEAQETVLANGVTPQVPTST